MLLKIMIASVESIVRSKEKQREAKEKYSF